MRGERERPAGARVPAAARPRSPYLVWSGARALRPNGGPLWLYSLVCSRGRRRGRRRPLAIPLQTAAQRQGGRIRLHSAHALDRGILATDSSEGRPCTGDSRRRARADRDAPASSTRLRALARRGGIAFPRRGLAERDRRCARGDVARPQGRRRDLDPSSRYAAVRK
jgi:hypothetical protein